MMVASQIERARIRDVALINANSIMSNRAPSRIKYIDISSVGSGEFTEHPKEMLFTEAPSRARRIVQAGDTILSTVRPNRRSFLYFASPPQNTIASTGFAVLTPTPSIDSRYLYYWVTRPDFTDYLSLHAKGAAYPAVSPEDIANSEIALPPLPIQRRIASILSAYDDLIENNQRRIRILQEMARSLYREWFVHFRYPGHESVPLVDSSLGQIPQGWEVKKVGDLLAKIPRQPKIKTQDYLPTGALPVIDQGREFVGGYTNDADAEYSGQLPVVIFGDHTRILKFVDFPFACGADGTQLIRSNDERMPICLFYYAVSALELSNFAYARHFKFLKEELIIVPESRIATAFADRVDPIKKHVRTLQQQTDNLRRTRDLLLPRLLSGQVSLAADTPPITA